MATVVQPVAMATVVQLAAQGAEATA